MGTGGNEAVLSTDVMPELTGLSAEQRDAYEAGWDQLVDLHRRPNGAVDFYNLFSSLAEPVDLDAVTQERLARIAVWPQGYVPDPYRLYTPRETAEEINGAPWRDSTHYPVRSVLPSLRNLPGVLEHLPGALVWALGEINSSTQDPQEIAWARHRYLSDYRMGSGRGYGITFVLPLANYLSRAENSLPQDDEPPVYEQLLTQVPMDLDYLSSNTFLAVDGTTPSDPYSYFPSEDTAPLTPRVQDIFRTRFLDILRTELPATTTEIRNRTLHALTISLLPSIASYHRHNLAGRLPGDIRDDADRLGVFAGNIIAIIDEYEYPTYYGIDEDTDSLMSLVGADNPILVAEITKDVEERLTDEEPLHNLDICASIMNRLPTGHGLSSRLQAIIDRNPGLVSAKQAQASVERVDADDRKRANDDIVRTQGALALAAMRLAVKSVT